MKTEKFVLFSKKYGVILWLPEKTGSTHCWSVMSHFDFKRYILTPEKQIDYSSGVLINGHSHEHGLPHEHQKFSIIQTMRNPYTMLSSYFKMNRTNKVDIPGKNTFYDFVYFSIYNDSHRILSHYNYSIRKPDYFIRVEHLFEDYSKIPFIRESELFKSGELELKCKIPLNKNNHNFTPWQNLYTQETADLVYYNFSKIFNTLGYDKNSWKK